MHKILTLERDYIPKNEIETYLIHRCYSFECCMIYDALMSKFRKLYTDLKSSWKQKKASDMIGYLMII